MAFGPSRHFAAAQQLGCSWREADINWRPRPARSVANDPAADRNTLTDMRIDLVKAALQLTPEQEKYWPAVESAIRSRADDRKGCLARKRWGSVRTKTPSKSCALVTPSPFCNDARKHWLNDRPIWINSPRRGSHSTKRLVPNILLVGANSACALLRECEVGGR